MGLDRYPAAVEATQPARVAFAITPSDSTDLDTFAKALYIGVSGDVSVHMAGDTAVSPTTITFKSVPIGTLPVQVRRVLAATTTATNIIGLTD